MSRSRMLAASPEEVWRLVSDPHNMPRWWPRVTRVEDVNGPAGSERTRWTAVLETGSGTGVRADYRCVESRARELYAWEQELEGTPFERILRFSRTQVGIVPGDPGAEVGLTSDEGLRGLSRLGSPMIRLAARRRLEEALRGIERALVAGDEPA